MSYRSSFKEVKEGLPLLYLDLDTISPLLRDVSSVTIKLVFNEYAIKPVMLVYDKKTHKNITDCVQVLKPTDSPTLYHVGYKRQDDFLGRDGKLIHRSNSFRRDLEYVKCGRSWLRWIVYKLAGLLRG